MLKRTDARTVILLRQAANLTQPELAQRLGVARNTVTYWETGRSHPTRQHYQRLIDVIFGAWLRDKKRLDATIEKAEVFLRRLYSIRCWLEAREEWGPGPSDA